MSFFHKRRFFVLLIGIIILIALIGYSLNNRENLTTPEKFIQDAVGWVQNVIHAPVTFVTNIFGNLDDLKNTYNENQILKEKLAEYKSLIYEVQELKEDNDELRKTLEKTESIQDFDPIQATVISRSPERWVERVTINKGSQHGIEPNMAVITAEGMIGKVQTVSKLTSTVQLITGFDEFNRISATISREEGKDIFGLIEEFDEESNSLSFKIIEESKKDLEEGELVISSGMGGVFPAGLLIGTVKEVVSDQYGLTRTALIKPAANMYDINHVIVVDRKLQKDDKQNEEQEEKE
ncbi:rod shape-determining protein MreC [Virgibacillus alimentarius]|uniref:Cell shape-determining protein MreC n=1 Tax=Virgibacillus alimentarius TaxID=698769 RepID=A0ABS4S593_9BACI|nr:MULTISPECIES: rod shape-determining protein MreC [Virgibacillus]MBP2256643.1 rod shape-determining protein MreC [Virgibacillus alimentarius]HLR67106.1 rod shape-determining protein MreC [Virgibacillus sp.]